MPLDTEPSAPARFGGENYVSKNRKMIRHTFSKPIAHVEMTYLNRATVSEISELVTR